MANRNDQKEIDDKAIKAKKAVAMNSKGGKAQSYEADQRDPRELPSRPQFKGIRING